MESPEPKGLHVIWTTRFAGLPNEIFGAWSHLNELYEDLKQSGHLFEMSKPIHPKTKSALVEERSPLLLSNDEVVLTRQYIEKLVEGDLIVEGLALKAFTVDSHSVQLVIRPAIEYHSQIIGRMKSKTSSWLLRTEEREGQKHIWERGYWFTNIEGDVALEKVESFIRKAN